MCTENFLFNIKYPENQENSREVEADTNQLLITAYMKLRIVYKYKYVLELFKTKIFEDEKVPILHKTRPKMTNIRVAIVGAGAAGLAMCRYLVNEPQIDFVAFEKGSDIGGVWRYTKGNEQTVDEHNSSPMYKNLRYSFIFVILR